MTSRDFCYWLQGFFEVRDARDPSCRPPPLSAEQEYTVKQHLALVFKHEIDPSMGPPAHQATLNAIHAPPPPKPAFQPGPYKDGESHLIRC